MTATVMPAEVVEALKPDYVAPIVGFLAHDSCEDNGGLYEVGAGYVCKLRWQRTGGVQYPVKGLKPETVAAQWNKVTDFNTGATFPESNQEMMEVIMNNLEAAKEAEEKAAASGGAAAGGEVKVAANKSGLASETIFNMMGAYCEMGQGKDAVAKCKAKFGFDITLKKGGKPAASFAIDLKNGNGSVSHGAPKEWDAYFTMTDADFVKLCQGKANGQTMFM
jgi:3-hydroxyacyl-CoA dehydrogenase/3a,7a,12a-trihydroxy-5b-cholest-24-enoyl-CoA hydratase